MACQSRICYLLGVIMALNGLVLIGYGLHVFVIDLSVNKLMHTAINIPFEKAAVDHFQRSYNEPTIANQETKVVRPSLSAYTKMVMRRKQYGNNAQSKGLCYGLTAGGEITFINREDGSVNFSRGWLDYKRGFGHPHGEFWLGLDCLHKLTSTQKYELRVDFGDFEGKIYQSRYHGFTVWSESEGYKLHVVGYDTSSNGGDSLTHKYRLLHNTMKFSTHDRDNDKNCAYSYKGGWWYNACAYGHPTGLYLKGGQMCWRGVRWWFAKRNDYSFKYMTFTLIPKDKMD